MFPYNAIAWWVWNNKYLDRKKGIRGEGKDGWRREKGGKEGQEEGKKTLRYKTQESMSPSFD